VHGRWFSSGTPDSSTTKTGSHDIAEILLKVASNTINQQIRAKTGWLRIRIRCPRGASTIKIQPSVLISSSCHHIDN
jgi:hypothetical protein